MFQGMDKVSQSDRHISHLWIKEWKECDRQTDRQTDPSLVNAGLCVCYLIERGDFKAVCVASLSFVHIISKRQHHLQQLLEIPAV